MTGSRFQDQAPKIVLSFAGIPLIDKIVYTVVDIQQEISAQGGLAR
jgi:hypothetical protein